MHIINYLCVLRLGCTATIYLTNTHLQHIIFETSFKKSYSITTEKTEREKSVLFLIKL
jgi:hypothetical protein